MKKIKVKYVLILILLILFVLLFFCIKSILNTISNDEIKTLATIQNYNYTLNENDSEYFKTLFQQLNECLNEKELNEEEYAKLVSQLFVTDFYSLEYAISKNDIGGLQFILTDYLNTFQLKAKDTIYAHVESNLYGERNQKLPNVQLVEVVNVEQDVYDGNKEQDKKAYFVDLEITYEEDLGYPKQVSIVLIHKNNKLQIVKVD